MRLPVPVHSLLSVLALGCFSNFKGVDNDGDGISSVDGDCWDQVEGPPGSGLGGDQIYPGAPDTPYDGIDADCSGNDDFDLDGDGYVAEEEHYGQSTLGLEGTGENHVGWGDCWDDPGLAPDSADHIGGAVYTNVAGAQITADLVNPGSEDTWYDGPDQDCGGNDDFDQDGDGYATDKAISPDGVGGTDCFDLHPDDDPNTNLAGLPAESIHSGATETWYDGTDQDCSGVYNTGLEVDEVLADCDLDGDGAPVADGPDVPDSSVCRDYTGIARDCNDESSAARPDSSIEEIFYNGVDDNCTPVLDGEPDTDGDADRDGHWRVDYELLVTEVDDSVNLDGVVYDDCWDNPDTTPAAYVGEAVRVFDAQADPDDPDSFAIAFAAGSLRAADVHPSALDRPYDGVDQDCAGDDSISDEYDWDGDGEQSMYQWYTHPDLGGADSGPDCMDCNPDCATAEGTLLALCEALCDNDAYVDIGTGGTLNPGGVESDEAHSAASDPPYDGTDQDCRRNIDFDEDGDYYATDPAAAIAQGQTREAYYFWNTIGFLYASSEDCNDTDATINPGLAAGDSWYDGEDTDCDGEDDYDQDYDGYVSDSYQGLQTYAAALSAPDRDDYVYSSTGFLPGNDCNDDPHDDGASYNPAQIDSWYDGNDTDCAYNDDYDVDADGYASLITSADYGDTYHGSALAVSGVLDATDCDDQSATVHPGAGEVWYDGVDGDCDGVDDYDLDGDGFADSAYASVYGPTTHEAGAIAGTGALDATDCNDVEEEINPGATEVWYDGVDADCGGDDDFDADGDGAASATWASAYSATYQSYSTSTTYLVVGTGALPTDDCDDTDPSVGGGAAAETWYDGVDSDCGEDDDYDADADGYASSGFEGLVTYSPSGSPVAGTGSLPGGDCEDSSTSYYPGAPDAWYDGLDHDCADNDDWDSDADGHAATAAAAAAQGIFYAAYGQTTQGGAVVSGTGSLTVDDCNDLDPSVNGGATDDWYDGVDADCGADDDFDADGDASAALSASTSYGSTYQSSVFDSAYLVAGTGTLTPDDCNDEDAWVSPGLPDTWYDGVDSDCDATDDFDQDLDGYVADAYVGTATYQSSTADPGHLLAGTGSLPGDDCNDQEVAFNPGEVDLWYDGFDNDCDRSDDYDQDKDGFVAAAYAGLFTYEDSAGVSAVVGTGLASSGDCNDTDAAVYLGATDAWYDGIDHDCDAADDFDQDSDGDAYEGATYTATFQDSGKDSAYMVSGTGTLATNADCNDTDASVLSTGTEVWYDGVDTDCGGNDDFDADADGYASLVQAGVYAATYQSSIGDAAYVLGSTGTLSTDDCDDTAGSVNPGATETWYDGTDQNCDEADDWDADADGHANADYSATYTTTTNGSGAISGTGLLSVDDCNDIEATVSPSAADTSYDGTDADCNGTDDYDQDGDGYVPDAYSGLATYQSFDDLVSTTYELSATGSLPAGDCLDQDAFVYNAADYNPGAIDVWYDGQDQDCSGDDDYDQDNDGYVRAADLGSDTRVALTVVFSGAATLGGDCNDAESGFRPDASDAFYDGLDHDCDDADDYDQDLDGYVDSAYSGLMTYTDAAQTTAVAGTGSALTHDCDDTNAATNSGQTEVCDASDVDEDCDGLADDSDPTVDSSTQTTYYTDADADSYGLDGSGSLSCNAPAASSLVNGDCNDSDPAINSGATEIVGDSVDQNCDTEELCYTDADNDGYRLTSTRTSADEDCSDSGEAEATDPTGDCDDSSSAVNPGETEVCDSSNTDEDCNGTADDADAGVDPSTYSNWYVDADSDGYGDGSGSAVQQCDSTSGRIDDNSDCDDSDAGINPGESETLDGADNDCDDDYDEGLITTDSEYVLITEIMIDSDNVSDIFGEWFEVYNPNAFDITIDEDWVFYRSAGAGFNPPSDLVVAAGDYAIFVRNSNTSVNGNVTGDFTYGGAGIGSLAQGGDYLVAAYFDPDDIGTDTSDLATAVVVDEVDWDSASWTFTIPTGATLQLDNDGGYPTGVVSDDDTKWCEATVDWDAGDFGSPGAGNEACP